MKQKIKVLQLGNAGEPYGSERWILAFIKYLNTTRVESWVASIRDDPSLKASVCLEAEKLGFPIKIFECYGKFNFRAVRQLRKFILKNDIDIIHAHHYKTDIIGLLATRGTSCKIVSTPHGWTKQPGLKLWVYEIFDRLIFPFFDAIAPLSENLYKSLSSIPGIKNKLYYIKNGVDINEIDNVKEGANEMYSLKRDGAFIVGYIGRLVSGKGLDILLNAVAKYGEPHWIVAIIGEGELLSELKAMARRLNISSQVKFFGFRPDRLSFLKGFDIFVLPSRSEGIPRCLMEAMAAGVPVVASDIPGCRHLIDGKTTGLLFRLDEPKQMADSIKRISSDPILRESLSRDGRKLIQYHFSAARMAKEYEELFFRLYKSKMC